MTRFGIAEKSLTTRLRRAGSGHEEHEGRQQDILKAGTGSSGGLDRICAVRMVREVSSEDHEEGEEIDE
jgi:hypothetical protein